MVIFDRNPAAEQALLERGKTSQCQLAPFSRQDEKFRMAISSGIDDLLSTSCGLLFKKQDAMGRAWTPCLGFKLDAFLRDIDLFIHFTIIPLHL